MRRSRLLSRGAGGTSCMKVHSYSFAFSQNCTAIWEKCLFSPLSSLLSLFLSHTLHPSLSIPLSLHLSLSPSLSLHPSLSPSLALSISSSLLPSLSPSLSLSIPHSLSLSVVCPEGE